MLVCAHRMKIEHTHGAMPSFSLTRIAKVKSHVCVERVCLWNKQTNQKKRAKNQAKHQTNGRKGRCCRHCHRSKWRCFVSAFLHADRQTIFCVCRVSVCVCVLVLQVQTVFQMFVGLEQQTQNKLFGNFRSWKQSNPPPMDKRTHISNRPWRCIEFSQNLVFNCPKHFTQMYYYMPNIPNLAKGIDSGHSKFNIQIHEIDGIAHNSL